MRKPKPGLVMCLGFCDKKFNSKDVFTNRICPSCTKKMARESSTHAYGTKVYNDNRPLSHPDN